MADAFPQGYKVIDEWQVDSESFRLIEPEAGPLILQIQRDNGEWEQEKECYKHAILTSRIVKQSKLIAELKDFAIWMTGCGYDFCQHEYFNEQRDKLLKE